ncbi:hypothetical protein, conserved [Trypanosoma brucei brucei TREU927]|uniref:Uncharacterized protein n=1 Tax=Trypanosoma brucei brucei (strain 927/4 GUTat10.1) TaxID=185431 RepID=Q384J1_TRYB2|nr:hypothetical protein, conserved [Trypanosoma brucei brucei TREU927]EAN79790.1 hypothetical protein, conserved [Trypanosoma brucei brucei TREU927]
MDDVGDEEVVGMHADKDDLNSLLMSTKTASEYGVEASGRWVSRPKKRASRKPMDAGVSTYDVQKKSRAEHSTNGVSQAGVDGNTGGTIDGTSEPFLSSDRVLAPCPREVMVNRVMEYVMMRELGGRHNTTQCGEEGFAPFRAALLAETASMRPVAEYDVIHSVRGMSSVPCHEKAPDAVVQYRRRLYCCSYDRDLVGGHSSGKPPHTREHLRALVGSGLRGKGSGETVPVRTTSQAICEAGKPDVKAGTNTVLFDDTRLKPASSFLQDSSSGDDESV